MQKARGRLEMLAAILFLKKNIYFYLFGYVWS